jgi:hypothetical protein
VVLASEETRLSALFRTQLVLMIFGAYAYGDHVSDPRAFPLRLSRVHWRVLITDDAGEDDQ